MSEANGRTRRRSEPGSSAGSDQEDSPAKRVKLEEGPSYTQRAQNLARMRMEARRAVGTGDGSDTDESDSDFDLDEEEAMLLDENQIEDADALAEYRTVQEAMGLQRVKNIETAGWIKQIHLIDFMNHANLRADLSPRLNFLVGHNGSGKSALLTAIAIVLGGKASMTGRGNGLKSFIRGEEPRSVITMTICNKGYNAYKPEVYGESIIIERTIARSGASPYKIRNSDGKTIATKKDELRAICDAFIIDVDQPLTILTQDAARSFLARADDKQLYDFFLRGTGLRALGEIYFAAGNNVILMQNAASAQKTQLPLLEKKLVELDHVLKMHGKIKEMKAEKKLLMQERAWACVSERENEHKQALQTMEVAEGLVSEKKDKLAIEQAELDRIESDLAVMERELNEFSKSRDDLDKQRRTAKLAYEQAKSNKQDIEGNLSENRTAVRDCNNELEELNDRIDRMRQRMAAGRDPAQVKAEEEQAKAERILAGLKGSARRSEMSIDELETEVEKKEEAVRSAETELDIANGQRNGAREAVQRLQRQTTDRLSAFGTNLDIVQQMIDREQWSGRKPLGPMGRHVSLLDTDEHMRKLFSVVLGQFLCGFVVQTAQDRQKMQQLLARAAARGYRQGMADPRHKDAPAPVIIQNSGDIFDFSSGDMTRYEAPRVRTMYNCLKFENEWVERVLIVAASIERVFATKSAVDAKKQIDKLIPVFNGPPVTVYSALNDQGSPTLLRQSGDLTGRQGAPVGSGPLLFTNDVQEDLRAAQRHQRDVEANFERAVQVKRTVLAELDEAKRKLADARLRLAKERSGIKSMENTIAKCQEVLVEEPSAEVDTLVRLRKETSEILERVTVQLEVGEENMGKAVKELEETTKVHEEMRKRLEGFETEKQQKRNLILLTTQQRGQKIQDIKTTGAHIRELDRKRATAEAKSQETLADIGVWTQQAFDVASERIITKRDPAKLLAKENVLKIQIETYEKQQGVDYDQVKSEHVAMTKAVRKLRTDARDLDRSIKIIERALKERAAFRTEMRIEASLKTRVIFLANMETRGMEGRIAFNHNARTLKMGVKSGNQTQSQDDGGDQSQYKSAKLLSGGERSYATVSLLLALWESTSSPLRCLDEWDVFLDSVNRTLAANLLIEGTRKSHGRQYILITPQSMPTEKNAGRVDMSDAKIIRMADPTRHQGTLAMGR